MSCNLPVLEVFGRFFEIFFRTEYYAVSIKLHFFLISMLLIYLFSLIALARISTTMLNNRGEETFCHFPNLGKKTISL